MSKNVLRILGAIWAISGIVILFGVFVPIFDYNKSSQGNVRLLSPISNTPDYTKASNWFIGGMSEKEFTKSKVTYYTLSIPKLKIEDATVTIGGEDLSKSLIQYPGTALPGKKGNAVIFGHSILPIFYNPKDYLAIFSTLPTLKEGDEVNISYDGVSFKYKIESMFEVLPTDIQVLEQDANDSFLTLVTCVPPGDPRKPKRLIVRARIVPYEAANANTRS